MGTLLLRLVAPLQSWGTDSNFDIRRTEREPSKSGVIGMLASALGLSRDEELGRLKELKFGVRVDREGEIIRDFHIARNDKDAYVTNRYYLSDAGFLVGLESDDSEYLKDLAYAITHPAFPLFLGRRACPPTQPLFLGIRATDLKTALIEEPSIVKSNKKNDAVGKIRMIIDCDPSDSDRVFLNDMPVSFSQRRRKHSVRTAKEEFLVTKCDSDNSPSNVDLYGETEHGAMKGL